MNHVVPIDRSEPVNLQDSLEYRLGYKRGWRQAREDLLEKSEPVDYKFLAQQLTNVWDASWLGWDDDSGWGAA